MPRSRRRLCVPMRSTHLQEGEYTKEQGTAWRTYRSVGNDGSVGACTHRMRGNSAVVRSASSLQSRPHSCRVPTRRSVSQHGSSRKIVRTHPPKRLLNSSTSLALSRVAMGADRSAAPAHCGLPDQRCRANIRTRPRASRWTTVTQASSSKKSCSCNVCSPA